MRRWRGARQRKPSIFPAESQAPALAHAGRTIEHFVRPSMLGCTTRRRALLSMEEKAMNQSAQRVHLDLCA